MKLYRYMSTYEYDRMLHGQTIYGGLTCEECRTSSAGVCFLADDTVVHCAYDTDIVMSVERMYNSFLMGVIRSDSVLVEFETSANVKKTIGTYADPIGDYYDLCWINEYCVSEYSRRTFTPLRSKPAEGSNWRDIPAEYYDSLTFSLGNVIKEVTL